MADISNILAALAAQRQNGTPSQAPPQPPSGGSYPPGQYATPPSGGTPFNLPQPISSGSFDIAGVKPVSTGSVSLGGDKVYPYDTSRESSRNANPRLAGRGYRRSRSPSRTPPRSSRDGFRDNYNPYRDERRGGDRGYQRDRSFSPRPGGGRYSPPQYRDDRSPGRDRVGPADGESEVLPIEKAFVGLIIGRSGENLRRVEGSTGARVQFMDGPETTSAQRHCRISGSRAARAAAKAEIFRIIEDNELAKRGQDKSRLPSKASSVATVSKEGDSLQIMVPDRTVGLIIGRGGESIRELQERSGCHVNIVGENKSVNGLRPVNLIGSAAAQQHARDLILEIVESDQKGISVKELRSSREQEDPYGKINDRIMVPGDAVGMIIGKGGESIKDMQSQTGCKINVSPATGRDVEREIGLVGTRHAIDAAKRAIMEKVDASEQRARTREGRDDYGDRYGGQSSTFTTSAAAPSVPQPAGGAPASGEADPYAAYGGYQNYLQMWYAAMAQQQQQGGQGQGEQR